MRAHARAAVRIGFEPHLFCAGFEGGTVATDYGTVHRVLSPLRHFRHEEGGGVRVSSAVLHDPLISAAVERFLGSRRGPHLIHGFGLWAHAGVKVSGRLRNQKIEIIPISSAYTLYEHEHDGKVKGITSDHGLKSRLFVQAERWWIKRVMTRYERNAYFGSRLVLVNYESVSRLLTARFGSSLRIRKTPYTSEAAFIRPVESGLPMPDDLARLEPRAAPLIVAVSRHDPRKGVDMLIRALAELRAAGVLFRACLVGGGQLLASHRRLAASLGLEAETLITGFVADSYAYLQYADLFVLPSLEEGSGSVSMLEALQAGVPVVASRIDGIPEDVTDGETALLVEPGSVAALNGAIGGMLADAELRRLLARRARGVFEKKFSPEVLTGALRETYAELGFVP